MDDIKTPRPVRAQLRPLERRDFVGAQPAYGSDQEQVPIPPKRHFDYKHLLHKIKQRLKKPRLTKQDLRWLRQNANPLILAKKAHQKGIRRYQLIGIRPVPLFLLLVILISTFGPVWSEPHTQKRYDLGPNIDSLIGASNPKFAAKLKFHQDQQQYIFNEDAQPEANSVKASGVTYMVNFNTDPRSGIKVSDTVNNVAFTMRPQFSSLNPHPDGSRMIYPLYIGGVKAVYSLHDNGLKEDLILEHNVGDSLTLGYKLDLPSGMQARVNQDGSVGFYVAQSELYGNITYGSDADREMVEKARQNSPKTNLVFSIPAPIIAQQNHKPSGAKAHYELQGDLLLVVAEDLNKAEYPLSIDPTVAVTSSSQFTTSNYEENNIRVSSGSLTRDKIGTALASTRSTNTAVTTGRTQHAVLSYNGFLYVVGGQTTGNNTTQTVYVTSVTSTGGFTSPNLTGCAAATWCATTSVPTGQPVMRCASVIYQGYIYLISGSNDAGTITTGIIRSRINSDGSIGSWSNTGLTALPASRNNARAVVYNGYLYVSGGLSSGAVASTVVYWVKLNGDGTIGNTWATTNGTNLGGVGFNFTGPRSGHGFVANNNFLYVFGGITGSNDSSNPSTLVSTVYYSKISSTGAPGSWVQATQSTSPFSSTTMPTALSEFGYVLKNNAIYVFGGCDTYNTFLTTNCSGYSNTVFAAEIHEDGNITDWITETGTIAMSSSRSPSSASVGDYIFTVGGCTGTLSELGCTGNSTAADVNPIAGIGSLTGFGGSGTFTTGRYGASTVAYNGYLYIIGGCTNANCTTVTTDVQFASLTNTGTLSFSSTTNALAAARYYAGAVAYDGRLYLVGGCTVGTAGTCTGFSNSTQYVGLSTSTGNTTGAWTNDTTNVFTTARYGHSVVEDHGFVYVLGGCSTGACGGYLNDVQYAQINSAGGYTADNPSCAGTATFCTDTSFSTSRYLHASVAYNGYVYVMGGIDNTAAVKSDVQFAQLVATGGLTSDNPSCSGTATWCTTNSLNTARYAFGATVNNGIIYAAGGCTAGNCTSFSSNVESGMVDNDGNIDLTNCSAAGWCSTGTFTTGRYGLGVVSARSNVYLVGGCTAGGAGTCSTFNNGFETTRARDGGPYTSSSQTDGGSASMTTRAFHTTLAYNGYLYVIGGCTAASAASCTPVATAQYSTFTPRGLLSGFSSATSLTAGARKNVGGFVYNGRLYVLGGCTDTSCTTYSRKIESIVPNSDGSLPASWTDNGAQSGGADLPSDIVEANYAAADGYAFRAGGNVSGSASNTTASAAINSSTGVIGSWSSGGTLTTARKLNGVIAYHGYIYAIGGTDGSGNELATVEYSRVVNGSPASWTVSGNRLPVATSRFASDAIDGVIIVAGGTQAGTRVTNTYTATLAYGGDTSSWQRFAGSDNMNTVRADLSGIIHNGIFYAAGGTNASNNTLGDTQHFEVMTPPRIATYSRVEDTDADSTPRAFVFRSSNYPTTSDTLGFRLQLQYSFAASVTATQYTYDSQVTTTVTPETPLTFTSPAQGVGRYFLIRLVLDERESSIYPDVPNSMDVSDYDIYFSANTGKRMRNGKVFTGEVQNNLDAHP